MRWCRPRVKFNEVPEKVPKVPEKVWEVLVQSQVTFNKVPEKVLEKGLWCSARSGSTGKVPEKVPGSLGSGESSGESSGEGRGGLGADPHSREDLGGLLQS